MSHKRFYTVFNPTILRWQTRGIPYDDGPLENNKDELFFGPFKTLRAAAFCAACGYLTGSLKDTEAMAKLAETKVLPETQPLAEDILALDMDLEIPVEYRSSYVGELLRMMD